MLVKGSQLLGSVLLVAMVAPPGGVMGSAAVDGPTDAMVMSMIRDLEEDRDRQMRMSDGWLRQKLPIVLDEMV